MIHTFEDLKRIVFSKKDFDRYDLEAYEFMWNYLQKKGVSCKILNCTRCKDDKDSSYHYQMEFILSDCVEFFEKLYIPGDKDKLICKILCDNEKSRIKTNVFHFLCARKWEQDVKSEMSTDYPDYYMNVNHNIMDDYRKVPRNVFYKNGTYDYGAYIDYIYSNQKRIIIQNSINVFLPDGVEKEDTDKLYENMKPLLKKYFIKEVHFVKPVNQEAFLSLKENEQFMDNVYTNKEEKDGVLWTKSYCARRDNYYKFDKKKEAYVESFWSKIIKGRNLTTNALSIPLAIIFFPITIMIIIYYIIIFHVITKSG